MQDRRRLQQRAAKDLMAKTHEKVLARVLAKDYLKNVRQNVMRVLVDQGVYRKPFEKDLYTHILPWMYGTTWEMMEENKMMDEILLNLVGNAFGVVAGEHGTALDKERDKKLKKKKDEEDKKEARKLEKEKNRLEMIEKKRIDDLKALELNVENNLVNKGDVRNEMIKQEIVEITGNYQNTHSVGVPGGLITELAIALTSAFELSPNKDWLNENNIFKFVVLYIADKMGCPQYSVYLGPHFNQLITSKGLKLDTLHLMDAETEKEFVNLYKTGENDDMILKMIKDQSAEFNIDPKIIEILREAILKLLIKKQTEKEAQGKY